MVLEFPDRILMKSDWIEYDWRDIDRGSASIAGELYALGVRSGSTGTPKGVMLSHFYLISSSDYCVCKLNMAMNDRISFFCNFIFFGTELKIRHLQICGQNDKYVEKNHKMWYDGQC